MIDSRADFYVVYSNLPLGERHNVICVINGGKWDREPVSWRIVKLEVDGGTTLGERILKQLKEMKLI